MRPSQFAKPALQLAIVQAPALQVGVAFGVEQALPQAPQFATSVERFTSQPFPELPSQFAKPALQVIPQVEPVQVAVPFVELQTLPQAPQFEVSLVRCVSHPLPAFPSQFPNPALHVMPQV